jgi:hypothetical protein
MKVMREASEGISARQVEIGKSVTEVQESVKVVEDCLAAVNATQIEAAERMNAIGVSVSEVCEKVNELGTKLGVIESSLDGMVAKQGEFEGMLECDDDKELFSTVLSRKQKRESRRHQQVTERVEGEVRVVSKTAAVELTVAELSEEWPMPAESLKLEPKPKKRQEDPKPMMKKETFGEWLCEKPNETVLVVGSSLARGVGSCLERESAGRFRKLAYGGAKIQDIERRIQVIGDKPMSHVVVMVGTNNLESEGSERIVARYKDLISEIKRHSYRKVSFVGILTRKHVSEYINSKRIGVNMRLKKLCEEAGFGFVEKDVVSDQLHSDGIHLNTEGQNEVARMVFWHCMKFLN